MYISLLALLFTFSLQNPHPIYLVFHRPTTCPDCSPLEQTFTAISKHLSLDLQTQNLTSVELQKPKLLLHYHYAAIPIEFQGLSAPNLEAHIKDLIDLEHCPCNLKDCDLLNRECKCKADYMAVPEDLIVHIWPYRQIITLPFCVIQEELIAIQKDSVYRVHQMDLDFPDTSFHEFLLEFGLSWTYYMSDTTFEEIQGFHLPILVIDTRGVESYVYKSIGFDGEVFKVLLYDDQQNEELYEKFELDKSLKIHLLEPKEGSFEVFEYHGDAHSIWDIKQFVEKYKNYELLNHKLYSPKRHFLEQQVDTIVYFFDPEHSQCQSIESEMKILQNLLDNRHCKFQHWNVREKPVEELNLEDVPQIGYVEKRDKKIVFYQGDFDIYQIWNWVDDIRSQKMMVNEDL